MAEKRTIRLVVTGYVRHQTVYGRIRNSVSSEYERDQLIDGNSAQSENCQG
jgi:hypothetical protein